MSESRGVGNTGRRRRLRPKADRWARVAVKVYERAHRRWVGPRSGTVGPGSLLSFSILFSIPFSLFPSLNLNFEFEFEPVINLFLIIL